MKGTARITKKGLDRVLSGHPWVFRSDVREVTGAENGDLVAVEGPRGDSAGVALYSSHSEITLRTVSRDPSIDDGWIARRVAEAVARRERWIGPRTEDNACRVVHGESDGLPGLVVDRYGDFVVAQLLSFGIDRREHEVIEALRAALQPSGILARNDPKVREREGLARETRLLWGDVPKSLRMREGNIELSVDAWTGQKTGAFLDQRANHIAFGAAARGRTLDAFCHDGGFGLQAAARDCEVVAVDLSVDACARTTANARANALAERVRVVEANVFDYLTEISEAGPSFDTIVLDPPAFAKSRTARESAARGYREINRRAFGLLRPGGVLVTASCSHHISTDDFRWVVEAAAADAGRMVQIVDEASQAADHPVLLGMPESRYLKLLTCQVASS